MVERPHRIISLGYSVVGRERDLGPLFQLVPDDQVDPLIHSVVVCRASGREGHLNPK